jgi:hypothetical protein
MGNASFPMMIFPSPMQVSTTWSASFPRYQYHPEVVGFLALQARAIVVPSAARLEKRRCVISAKLKPGALYQTRFGFAMSVRQEVSLEGFVTTWNMISEHLFGYSRDDS